MNDSQVTAVQKVASGAQYVGGGTSIVFGLTPNEWSVIGVIVGILIGVAGLIVSWYYKDKHFRLAERRGMTHTFHDAKDADE